MLHALHLLLAAAICCHHACSFLLAVAQPLPQTGPRRLRGPPAGARPLHCWLL
jgi:hypothetical protein